MFPYKLSSNPSILHTSCSLNLLQDALSTKRGKQVRSFKYDKVHNDNNNNNRYYYLERSLG